jgi:hypothetical protein
MIPKTMFFSFLVRISLTTICAKCRLSSLLSENLSSSSHAIYAVSKIPEKISSLLRGLPASAPIYVCGKEI